MKFFRKLLFPACLFVLCLFFNRASANDSIYEARRNAYIDTALANFGPDAITLQAYRGVQLDFPTLDSLLVHLTTNGTADFDIVKLVRILFLTDSQPNGQYDSLILTYLNQVPFWISYDDTIRDYWSENHMCQWITSDWLLHEKYGKPVDSNLHYRVVHYLQLKIQYGFYETFSSVYQPYCFTGLVNLADFAQDTIIKNLAIQASQRLLRDLLMLTNDQGVFYPCAGRNYYGKYLTPYGQNHNNLIYLLTGFGQAPGGASHAGGFLASSTLPVDSVISSWTASIDTTFYNGHTLDSGFVINDSLSPVDKVAFQWSSGAYFHPEVAEQTGQLLSDSDLWHQVDFAMFSIFSTTPPAQMPGIAQGLSCASESSVICGKQISVFKHNSITLSSFQNFWPGKLGYEEMPCVASVGTTPVFTASGAANNNWDNRPAMTENNDLPYVSQHKNAALLMYRPQAGLSNIGFNQPEVTLYWQNADFDTVINDSLWLLGKQGNSYVGVRRYDIEQLDSLWGCSIARGQSWVIIVGDSAMYGSFSNFQQVIDSSKFQDSWYVDTVNQLSVYYAQIIIDTMNISYAWGVDTTLTGIENVNTTGQFKISPNPAADRVTLDLSAFVSQPVTIKAVNILGQEVYNESFANLPQTNYSISTSAWAGGIYLIAVENGQGRVTGKLVKE